MPSTGQRCSAINRASWTISSATSKSPRRRRRAPTNLPASSRKTALSVTSISSLLTGGSGPPWSSAMSVLLHHRPDLDHTVVWAVVRPRPGEEQSLIKISHLDRCQTTNHLRSLKERAIGHERVSTRVHMDTRDRMGQTEFIALSDLGAVFDYPLTGLRTLLSALLLRKRLPCCQPLLISAKQKKVFHRLFLSVLEVALQRMLSILLDTYDEQARSEKDILEAENGHNAANWERGRDLTLVLSSSLNDILSYDLPEKRLLSISLSRKC